jgi:hypothetical protein
VTVDYAYYNPASLVLREKGWLEKALADAGTDVEWVVSLGSNQANEYAQSGEADVSSTAGIAAVDEALLEVAEVYDLGRVESLCRVVFPATLPSLLVGIRGGVGLAWMFAVAAELIAASQGVGFLLSDGRTLARPGIIVASILLFAFVGNCSDVAVKEVRDRVVGR